MFFIIINGEATGYFSFQRGLRKGDPLSPYLFIIMAKALGRMIKKFWEDQEIKGIVPTTNCIAMIHHQFVDDTIFIGKA